MAINNKDNMKKGLFITLGLVLGLGIGINTNYKTNAKETKADGVWKEFYVYVPNAVSDYYGSGSTYNWLQHSYDAIEAHVYKDGGSSLSEWPGTLMNRLTPNVVGLGFNDGVGYDSLILVNCYNDNTAVRTRSTWDGATPISFDLSEYNTFTLSKYNCPTGADSGSFNCNYGWSIDVQSGTDSDVGLSYNGTTQFQNTSVTLTAGTTFKIVDTFGTEIISGEEGAGSAFSSGYVEYDNESDVFEVKVTGTYEVYAKPSVQESNNVLEFNGKVWMQIDSESEAMVWAEDFVTNVGCTAKANAKPANWDRYASNSGTYSWSANLTNGAKYLFTSATASNTGTWIEKAAFIHDMCVRKYDGCSVFMAYNDGEEHTRTPANLMPVVFSNNNESTALLIAVISSISLISLGGFFLLKKKKEN